MAFSVGFWLSWLGPVAILLIIAGLAKYLWSKPTTARELETATAIAPFVAGVSVLAIAIPITSSLLLSLLDTSIASWLIGALLAGITLALVSLIYKIALETSGTTVTLSNSNPWLPTAMTIQFTGMLLFIICAFGPIVAIALTHKTTAYHAGAPAYIQVDRAPPRLGTSRRDVLTQWGTPDQVDASWLSYQSGNTDLVLCFGAGRLIAFIQKDRRTPDAKLPHC